jgi:hypothetical protein
MTTPPAYLEAVHDLELTGRPLGLYLRLYHDHLDAWEFRAVKQIVLASEMDCSEDTIERGIALLHKLRYLEREPRKFGEVCRYRLAHSRQAREITDD